MTLQDDLTALSIECQENPVLFAEKFLGVQLTNDQKQILKLLREPPCKVLARSANTQGKSFIAAIAALWTFTCFPESTVIVTAPTAPQVQRILFKELRTLGAMYKDLFLPKASVLYRSESHQVVGYTASSGTSFQGVHGRTVCAIVDEATGVEQEIIEAISPMVQGPGSYTLFCFNPTDTAAHTYALERSGKTHLVVLNALKHPNIAAELAGEEPPFPNAIRLDKLREEIDLWCEPTETPQAEDFEFDGKWWRPSPVAEARLLGRYPSLGGNTVWTDALFEKCCASDVDWNGTVAIGCDPALFGDDNTAIAVRKGRCLVSLEEHNGWSPDQTIARLKELSLKYRLNPNCPPPVFVDEGGIGAAISHGNNAGFNFKGLNFASKPVYPLLYRLRRDEVHFNVAEAARRGEVSFKHIPKRLQEDLRTELLAMTYKLDYQSRRILEPKDDIKKIIGRSPDLADAVGLAFYPQPQDVFQLSMPTMQKDTKKSLLGLPLR